MSSHAINRRAALQLISVSAGASVMPGVARPNPDTKTAFTYSLNMATIAGQNLGLVKELEIAAKAGYQGVEIWMDSLQAYLQQGGTLKEVKTRVNDLGIALENCIAFGKWIVDDDSIRKQGIEQIKKDMDMLSQIGCKRIAATGFGAANDVKINPDVVAERYRAVLEMGEQSGIVPLLEMWGFMKMLSTVADVTYIAMASAKPKAKVLLDILHFYQGGTPLDTLHLLSPAATDILHLNDYPANSSPRTITDADRIYPGDGVAPIKQILKALKRDDQPLILSAELFNKVYYKMDALAVAKTALQKMRNVAEGV